MEALMDKSCINGRFSIATFDYQRVDRLIDIDRGISPIHGMWLCPKMRELTPNVEDITGHGFPAVSGMFRIGDTSRYFFIKQI